MLMDNYGFENFQFLPRSDNFPKVLRCENSVLDWVISTRFFTNLKALARIGKNWQELARIGKNWQELEQVGNLYALFSLYLISRKQQFLSIF